MKENTFISYNLDSLLPGVINVPRTYEKQWLKGLNYQWYSVENIFCLNLFPVQCSSIKLVMDQPGLNVKKTLSLHHQKTLK